MDVNRHVLTVDLRDDPEAIATYVEHHRQVWPEVLDSLRRVGVRAMDIYLLGRRLVMVVELEDGRDLRQSFASHHTTGGPRVAEWERLMKSLQQPPPGAATGEWWSAMSPIFHFEPDRAAAAPTAPGLRTS
jgi:L-rhamnose mutarotase